MAEGIFRALMENISDNISFSVLSRGIFANEGDSASAHSVRALSTLWNIDISRHKAKIITSGDITESDLILTAGRSHRDTLKQMYPQRSNRIFTLKQYIYPELLENDSALDISDPFGSPYERYETCAKEIYEYVNLLINKLANAENSA
jgi:protein-tyrosine phosphatase